MKRHLVGNYYIGIVEEMHKTNFFSCRFVRIMIYEKLKNMDGEGFYCHFIDNKDVSPPNSIEQLLGIDYQYKVERAIIKLIKKLSGENIKHEQIEKIINDPQIVKNVKKGVGVE